MVMTGNTNLSRGANLESQVPNQDAASPLPGGERDRVRGFRAGVTMTSDPRTGMNRDCNASDFGARFVGLDLNRISPLTLTLSPPGRGDADLLASVHFGREWRNPFARGAECLP
jgi:hypothetical protein